MDRRLVYHRGSDGPLQVLSPRARLLLNRRLRVAYEDVGVELAAPVDDRHGYPHGAAQPAAHIADPQALTQASARVDVKETVEAVLLVDRELVAPLLLNQIFQLRSHVAHLARVRVMAVNGMVDVHDRVDGGHLHVGWVESE